ncbi:aspartate kinase [Anaerorhabdus furcosa]|uniref:Aspartokinase n=1 Tax=Anaerorhabdus furcosa TaxID=118967 RepID=A0A1T4LAF2_9FIRM|nr:aspartate kinase [Anaerorhabdus furcosa]SJZ51729.1 aspartate kinase [Anaerorhabdus furcosa]
MIVSKFGGSSVASSEQFHKVKSIINQNPERKIVVTSASGKRYKGDNKITDLLYLIHAHLQYSVSFKDLFNSICNRFLKIQEELNLKTNILVDLEELELELTKRCPIDYLVSRGEYLTGILLSDFLGYKFVDAKDILLFNYDGTIDFEKTEMLVKEAVEQYGQIVVPGFYGAYPDGTIHVMKRGGSDITGSILARVINASVYENWTDVSGILMADPAIISHPKQIEKITYSELRELSYMGANVLHEDAIYPVKDLNIPILILNTNEPTFKGTMICETIPHDDSKNIITGIAGKKDFTVITLYRHNASNEVGLLRKALEVFEKYRINVEHVPSGIDNFSIVVSSKMIERVLYDVVSELKQVTESENIKVTNNLSLLAIVGRNMAKHIGVSGQLFKTLGEHEINIRMIAQGSDEINIIVGVENEDFEKAIRVLYDTFA